MTHRTSIIPRFIVALLVGLLLTTSAFAGSSKGKSAKNGRSKYKISRYKVKAGKHIAPYKRNPTK